MLADLLKPDRVTVQKRWSQLILETYPPDTAGFLKREKDRFLNPVGHAISQETATIMEELLGEMDAGRLSRSLDNLIGIRAVQEFSPSQAVGFMFLLKRAVREGLGSHLHDGSTYEPLLELESRVDRAALIAFDSFMKRRERLYEIGANEAKRRIGMLLERMNRLHSGSMNLREEVGEAGEDVDVSPGPLPAEGSRKDPPLDKRGNGR